MRITFLIYENGNRVNGPIVNQERVIRGLHELGHEVNILSLFHNYSPVSGLFKEKGFNVETFPAGHFTKDTVRWILVNLQKNIPDVFVADWIVPGIIAARYARKAGIITIGSLRSDDAYFWALMKLFASKKSRMWALSGVFCVSKGLQLSLNKDLSSRTMTHFIPSGVPFSDDVKISPNPIKILYLGRIENRQKNIFRITHSLCKLSKEFEDVECSIVGNGPDECKVSTIIKSYNVNHKVNLRPKVNPNALQSFLSSYNVILLFSDYEGTPGALLEGMANGLIPICNESSEGIKELIVHNYNGIIINNLGHDLTNSIKYLLEDKNRFVRIAQSARQTIKSKYTLKNTLYEWLRFLDLLAKSRRPKKKLIVPFFLKLPKLDKNLIGFDYRKSSLFVYIINRCRIFLGHYKKLFHL